MVKFHQINCFHLCFSFKEISSIFKQWLFTAIKMMLLIIVPFLKKFSNKMRIYYSDGNAFLWCNLSYSDKNQSWWKSIILMKYDVIEIHPFVKLNIVLEIQYCDKNSSFWWKYSMWWKFIKIHENSIKMMKNDKGDENLHP